jgi:hypothetical protein
MKKVLIFCLSIWTIVSNAQVKYDKVGQLGEFKNDWAIVQLDKKFGFINDKGEETIKPTYDKIGQFGEFKADWAAVLLNGKKGFINLDGKFISDEQKHLP